MVGLGNMGGRIARRIRDGGLPVVGFDVDRDQAGRSGVETATSVEELFGAADVVFFSLPDSRVVEQVVFGEGGALAACREGQIVVDLSTAAPSSSSGASRSSTRASRAVRRPPSKGRSRSWRAAPRRRSRR